jgi:ribonuclease BN (tRNA processing enzyme)
VLFRSASLDVAPLAAMQPIGPFAVVALLVRHTDESYAFRVSVAAGSGAATGPGLVYSGDCGRANDLIPLIRPGDTLLAEASFGAGPVPAGAEHLDAAAAARAATAGRAARLLLTHIQMGFDRAEALAVAQDAFAGPVQLVAEGDRFEI